MPSAHRQIHPHKPFEATLRRLADACCLAAGWLLAAPLTRSTSAEPVMLALAATLVAYYLFAEANALYRSWRGVSAERELLCAVLTTVYTIVAVLSVGFLTDYLDHFSKRSLVLWVISTLPFVAIGRLLMRFVQQSLRARGFNTRGYAVVGVNELGFQLARNIESSPHLGLKLIGFYDDRPAERTDSVPLDVGRRLGNIDELIDEAKAGRVHRIYITFPMRAEDRIRGVLARLSDTTASVYIVPDFFVFELLHSRWSDVGGLPAVSVFENPFYGVDGAIKRAADVCLATLILAIVAVPMLIVAAAVKLTSRGPAFFRQQRYGLDGRTIRVWKFRTMRVLEDGAAVVQATQNDPRLTPVGGFLRRTSLDELPQLFNVLAGSMSLVGPRPHANAHNETFRTMIQGYMLRHKVKPGITGLAQVNGWRGETDTLYKMQKRIEFDHQYIREWSPWLDLKILFKTVFTVFSGQNAY